MTAADHQSLASLVLGTGRTILAVLSDGAKLDAVSNELDTACVQALEVGHFAKLSRPPKRVGQNLWPKWIPRSNLSESILRDVDTYNMVDADDADDDDDGTENKQATKNGTPLVVAKKHAEIFGVEIKVKFEVPWYSSLQRRLKIGLGFVDNFAWPSFRACIARRTESYHKSYFVGLTWVAFGLAR